MFDGDRSERARRRAPIDEMLNCPRNVVGHPDFEKRINGVVLTVGTC
jgi:hypothetical protein